MQAWTQCPLDWSSHYTFFWLKEEKLALDFLSSSQYSTFLRLWFFWTKALLKSLCSSSHFHQTHQCSPMISAKIRTNLLLFIIFVCLNSVPQENAPATIEGNVVDSGKKRWTGWGWVWYCAVAFSRETDFSNVDNSRKMSIIHSTDSHNVEKPKSFLPSILSFHQFSIRYSESCCLGLAFHRKNRVPVSR